VHFDATLNLAWLLLGVVVLARAIRAACHQEGAQTRKSRWLHFVGVALIVTALFPYISATDDVLRIEHFQKQQAPHHHSNKQTPSDDLMRLYGAMDNPLVCPISAFTLIFFFTSIVATPAVLLINEIAPPHAGRSPPFLQLASSK
jgi:hypothetical protein